MIWVYEVTPAGNEPTKGEDSRKKEREALLKKIKKGASELEWYENTKNTFDKQFTEAKNKVEKSLNTLDEVKDLCARAEEEVVKEKANYSRISARYKEFLRTYADKQEKIISDVNKYTLNYGKLPKNIFESSEE